MNRLHRAARWYAEHGYHVFPLRPGGKKTLRGSNGFYDATTDLDQIDKWWSQADYNIGIACGASGLVVLDFDTYKHDVSVDMLFDEDDLIDCPIVQTASGGTHIYFKQPEGVQLTNRTGDLPHGIDVRGHGGYVVAPPSRIERAVGSAATTQPVDEQGGTEASYRFRAGHGPHEVEGTTLPHEVAVRLAPPTSEGKHAPLSTDGLPASSQEIRDALSYIPVEPGYNTWVEMLMAVHSVFPDDDGVDICEEWSPGYKGEVAKKFASFKSKSNGVTIASLYKLAIEHGYKPLSPGNNECRTDMGRVQAWLGSKDSVEYIRSVAAKRIDVGRLTQLLHALVAIAIDKGTYKVYISMRSVGNSLAWSGTSVFRQVARLEELGMVTVSKQDDRSGTLVDLRPLLGALTDETVEDKNEFAANHVGDDAFAVYPYVYAQKRREAAGPLLPSLGPTGLLLWGYLERGGTPHDLAEMSGLNVQTVRRVLKKYESCGLVTVEQVGKEKWYALVTEAENKLDEVRSDMQTAWVGQLRVARNYASTADYAALRLRQMRRSKMATPKDLAWWEELLRTSITRADISFDFLESVGYDGRRRVGVEKPVKRTRKRMDHLEEWRTWGRPLYNNYVALGDIPHAEKVRLLALAENVAEENWSAAYREMYNRTQLMLMMAHRRVHYERRPVEETDAREVPVHVPAIPVLQPTLF